MNSLVVFDSQFGNTEQIARKVAMTLTEYGPSRAVRVTEMYPDALRDIDLLVVGCPTQAWHSTRVTQAFIQGIDRERMSQLLVAAFDTRLDKPSWLTGSAANGLEKELQRRGAKCLLSDYSFLVTGTEGPLVEGEFDRAVAWAQRLHEEYLYQTARPVLAM